MVAHQLILESLNPYTKAYKTREAKGIGMRVLGLIAAGLVGLGAAIQHGWWAGPIGALCFVVLLQVCVHLANSEFRAAQSALVERFGHIQRAFLLASSKESSVVLLRERLAAIDGGKGDHLPSEIFSILDCAIARGSILLGHDGMEKPVTGIA